MGWNALASITEHCREVSHGVLFDLNAGLWTIFFPEFIGSIDTVWMFSCPFDPAGPLVIITSDVVQVNLIFLKFRTITSGVWSSVVVTFSGFGMRRPFETV